MPRLSLTRVAHFRATHHYGRHDWEADRNRAAFGSLAEPHPHDYRVEITVTGPPDPTTGFVVDLGVLDRVIADEIVGPLQDQDLNRALEAVEVGRTQPSTEFLAGWVWARLAPRVPGPATLVRVRVWEDETLAGEATDP